MIDRICACRLGKNIAGTMGTPYEARATPRMCQKLPIMESNGKSLSLQIGKKCCRLLFRVAMNPLVLLDFFVPGKVNALAVG